MKLVKIKSSGVHKKNVHKGKYNFSELVDAVPTLKQKLKKNPKGEWTIDFSDADSVILLNKALLKTFYHINNWSIPKQYLCPPIPSRADYIHRLADILQDDGSVYSSSVKGLDIGAGANAVYSIIGASVYGWTFISSDINKPSIDNICQILNNNPTLNKAITPCLQTNPNHLFKGVVQPEVKYHFSLCNPPFHRSAEEAATGTRRKVKNLGKHGTHSRFQKPHAHQSDKGDKSLNFGGQNNELWCPGGEFGFVSRMIRESVRYSEQILWFSCLISKGDNVRPLRKLIEKQGADELRIVEMKHGNKVSRFLAWTYQCPDSRKLWFSSAP
ncbi:23S rRNA (adenine(1618)-N(6))-methyltransferase RlmF [Vibrio salinus]|uniref:23S rRNA (adenine(1618)-N(6))-methyltransferase RlmF n=1 Tax=Vibrio salinus TaxID=2899784 RepID=UPI001E554325|nr:23S rRNA (adenine(1618)-N(6))-methyltransferase RlmF [Vibrio salinus]MCE0492400.1 23S rRNA (adenine(1618)-N(6))-methyltransferase RlmF [Vibrio salinus]